MTVDINEQYVYRLRLTITTRIKSKDTNMAFDECLAQKAPGLRKKNKDNQQINYNA